MTTERIPNNLLIFDNPNAPLRLESEGVGADYKHAIACNRCTWSMAGQSLMDTGAPAEEHLKSHGIRVIH